MTDPSRPDREMAAGLPDPEPVRRRRSRRENAVTRAVFGRRGEWNDKGNLPEPVRTNLGCWSLLVVVLLAWWFRG